MGQRAIDFGIEKLSQGDAGSRLIADELKHRARGAWTLLPTYINANQIYDFESGGACNIDTSEKLSNLIYEYLRSYESSAWVLLDNVSSFEPLDRATISAITTPFSFKNELFQLLNGNIVSDDAVHETFRFGGAYPFIGFITKLNQSLLGKIKRNRLSQEDMQFVVGGIIRVLLGAYDEESYIVFDLSAAA